MELCRIGIVHPLQRSSGLHKTIAHTVDVAMLQSCCGKYEVSPADVPPKSFRKKTFFIAERHMLN